MTLQQLHPTPRYIGVINPITERLPTFDKRKQQPIKYPSSDGLPMAESDFQRKPLMYAADSLDLHFASNPNVYVTGNIFLYYEKGDPSAVVSPDVFVVFGVEKKMRHSYKLWEENKAPDFVIEITSKSTQSKDKGSNMGLYAFLGIREYFLYDPTTDYLKPPLQGMRLDNAGYYTSLKTETLPDGTFRLHSEVLNLELRVNQSTQLRFYNPATHKILPNYAEANAIASEALQRAEREEMLRRKAEARIAELEAKLHTLANIKNAREE